MKYLALLLVFTLFAAAWANSDHVYDWSDHNNAEELYTALKDETDLIFIIYWFKGDDADEELKKKNNDIRDTIKNDLLKTHPEIVFTEVDMAGEGIKDKYNMLLADVMEIDDTKLDLGPIISVVNNGEGAWIHGIGATKEVTESVDIYIHEAKDRKQGGTGYVYGSDKARRDGPVSVGGK